MISEKIDFVICVVILIAMLVNAFGKVERKPLFFLVMNCVVAVLLFLTLLHDYETGYTIGLFLDCVIGVATGMNLARSLNALGGKG
jgi:hypothetical protein